MTKLNILISCMVAFVGCMHAAQPAFTPKQIRMMNNGNTITVDGVQWANNAAGVPVQVGAAPAAPVPGRAPAPAPAPVPGALSAAELAEINAYAAANPAGAQAIIEAVRAIGPRTGAYVGG